MAARRSGHALSDYPGTMPESLADGYRIQAEAIRLMDEPVLGWKVAAVDPAFREPFGASRTAGPAFRIRDGASGKPRMPVFIGGYAAGEAEFQLRIGELPSADDPTLEDVVNAIDRICIGIELAGSPFAGINRHGPAVTVSDFGNNNGLVVGVEIDSERYWGLHGRRIASRINGEIAGESVIADPDGPFAAAQFLFALAAAGVVELRSGQWISTGALTGAHEVRPGDCFEAEFEHAGMVACTFAPVG